MVHVEGVGRGQSPHGRGVLPSPRVKAHGFTCPRYTFNEAEGELPDWFVEEELQHRRKQLPLDRQTVEEYRQRWRQINTRPIKKVAEAKARKKRRVREPAASGKKCSPSIFCLPC